MELSVERRDPATLGLALDALQPWLVALGPVVIVDLETTGLPESRSAEIIEIGLLLLDPGQETVGVASTLVRPSRPIPPLVSRLTGLVDDDVAKVAVVGVGMRSHAGVAAKMFQALAKNKINIEMISTSEIKVSCIVKQVDYPRAVKVLHKSFGLHKK